MHQNAAKSEANLDFSRCPFQHEGLAVFSIDMAEIFCNDVA